MTRTITGLFTALMTAAVMTWTPVVSAESVDFGDYQVHYSIFSSSFLRPEIAQQYNLTRSQSIGVVNIAVMKEAEDGTLKSVGAQVEGQVYNDIQQSSFMGFRRVQEGEDMYYLAQFQYANGELMTFQITARPQGTDLELPIRVTQTLFNDAQN
ncbi:MAG: DUF4426 domain-containing protein [Marinobacter sp.]|uniref:DUF4426 domain-containing protein n=1 Tax=Marinobacter sp. TaxID=50741 RepID=UPI00299E57B1|nr:DUF4426 domain-containing protein [Marinobacter sp.]MDX1635090.1 DUF4426 domain-containing protein [Marinobacter sp.]